MGQKQAGGSKDARALLEQAERCRRLAGTTYDRETNRVLGEMASGFEKAASKLARKSR